MTTANPTAPVSNQPQIGFVDAPTNLPYPPSNNPPPYPGTDNNLPYPTNNVPYPAYPQNFNGQPNPQFPQLPQQYPGPSNAGPPQMDPNVYSTQPGPTTIIIQNQELQSEPMQIYCPNCKEMVTTNVKYKSGKRTHGAALFLCFMDADCCALLPYCCDAAKDAHHTCPKCQHYFGKKEPSL